MFYIRQVIQVLGDIIFRLGHHHFRDTDMGSLRTASTSSVTMTKCVGVVLLASEVVFSEKSSFLNSLAKSYIISPWYIIVGWRRYFKWEPEQNKNLPLYLRPSWKIKLKHQQEVSLIKCKGVTCARPMYTGIGPRLSYLCLHAYKFNYIHLYSIDVKSLQWTCRSWVDWVEISESTLGTFRIESSLLAHSNSQGIL